MGNGFQFIDIILIAVIALFLVARLRNALGRRDGHDTSNETEVGRSTMTHTPRARIASIGKAHVNPLPGPPILHDVEASLLCMC